MLTSQFSAIYMPIINEYLAASTARYEYSKTQGTMVDTLRIFQPRDMVQLDTDPFRRSTDACFMLYHVRISPTFSKVQQIATQLCATAPNPESFNKDECYTIGNKFNRYKLNIVNSARDNNYCLSNNARFNFLSRLAFRMNALKADLDLKVIEEYFAGLFTDYTLMTSDTKKAPYNSWLNLSVLDQKVIQIPTGGITLDFLANLSSTLLNLKHSLNASDYYIYLDRAEFNKFITKIQGMNQHCCSIGLGQFMTSGNGLMKGYVDPRSGFTIVEVPDKWLPYDPNKKLALLPVVNKNNYFVTNGDNDFRYIENIKDVGHMMSSRELLQVGNYDVYYRAANGDIQFEDAAWEIFHASLGSVRTSITDTVFYLASSEAKLEPAFAAAGVKALEHGLLDSAYTTI